MKLSYLWHGLPGHPVHPPLTDATIGAYVGHKHYTHGLVGAWPFILTVIGFVLLTVGGWLGGAITYVHGMRVLNLVDEPAMRAAAPLDPGRGTS